MLMSFFKRLFGLESDAERMASDLFGHEGDRRRTREKEVAEKIVGSVSEEPRIQQVMLETGLIDEHILDVYRRLILHENPDVAAKALCNPELLRWYAQNGGLEMSLDRDQAIQLFIFARDGRL